MSTAISSTCVSANETRFNADQFGEWAEGFSFGNNPFFDQFVLRDLVIFEVPLTAWDSYDPYGEVAWETESKFRLADLKALADNPDLRFVTTACGPTIMSKNALAEWLAEGWANLEKGLDKLNAKRLFLLGKPCLELPQEGFNVSALELIARDGGRYLVGEKWWTVCRDGATPCESNALSYSNTYDIDLGRFEP